VDDNVINYIRKDRASTRGSLDSQEGSRLVNMNSEVTSEILVVAMPFLFLSNFV
jgi:hypothetical protein